MKYKIGDSFNVLIPGFLPTVAKIDNIKEMENKLMYYITTVRFNFPKVAGRDNRTDCLNYYCH